MYKNKTGIISLSSAQNYGAVLQSHSLCKFLNDNYSNARIIDFTPKFIVGRYPLIETDKSSKSRFFKSFLVGLIICPFIKLKYHRFDVFRKKSKFYSSKKYVGHITDDRYDQYIIGSDQVFNLELTGNDTAFFLPSIKDASKKATYAASLGVNSLTNEQIAIIQSFLDNFNYISIREKTGCNLVKRLLPQKKIYHMIDPVFLNSKEYWSHLAKKRMYKEKYILIYAFVSFEKAYRIAKKINDKLKILWIYDGIGNKYADVNNIRGVGPKEFLSLILHAEYVVTDSFHGTAFSIIFNKNFYTIPYPGTESRVYDLLNQFNLANHIISNDIIIDRTPIDYKTIKKEIETQKRRTAGYFNLIYKK